MSLLVPLLLGCASGRSAVPAAAPPPQAAPLQPSAPVAFVDGIALDDPSLLMWLDTRRAALLQLPVVVDFGDPTRLGIARAWIGAGGDAPGERAVSVQLDDSALGVALLDHLRATCPAEARTCAVWLEGRWSPGTAPAAVSSFRVLRFVGPADASATRARVEAAGG